jgi:hypothetical protein
MTIKLKHFIMKNILFTAVITIMISISAMAQSPADIKSLPANGGVAVQPFLFSVNTLTGSAPYWSVTASSNYAQRTGGQFGYDGADQQLAVKGYLGNRFTLYANADLGFARNGGTTSALQAELLHDFIGGNKTYGARFGVGLGANRDFSNIGAVFSRFTASYDAPKWRMGGNLRIEKAFSGSRDGIDLVTSLGFQHRIGGPVFAGFEIMGQDLEGFWEADEAEGGAKLLIGPSVNIAPSNSRLSFSLSGGPVFYATHSTVIASGAIRDIGNDASRNGYTVRAMVAFNLQRR